MEDALYSTPFLPLSRGAIRRIGSREKSSRRMSSRRFVMGLQAMKDIIRDVLVGTNHLGGSCGHYVKERRVIRIGC